MREMWYDGDGYMGEMMRGVCGCRGCCADGRQVKELKKVVCRYLKEKVVRMNRVGEYVWFFRKIYEVGGIVIDEREIVGLLYKNYGEFEERAHLCDGIMRSK